VWHVSLAHGLDAHFHGRADVLSGSKDNNFDLNRFADLAVMLSHVADVIEGKIHNGGAMDVDLHSHPMQLLLVGGSTGLGGRADLRTQQQGERNGGHCSEDAIHGVLLECAGSSVRRSVVMNEFSGQERSIN
jgi:hypothetical protein